MTFEKTAPKKWWVSVPELGNLCLGPFPSRKRAREFAESLLRQPG